MTSALCFQHDSVNEAAVSHTLTLVLRYAITNRKLFHGEEPQKKSALVRQAAQWAAEGIDYIQLREKDLSAAELADLTRRILEELRGTTTCLLINSRADVAVATCAHGVHLAAESDGLTPNDVRRLYTETRLAPPVVSLSCHTQAEAEQARSRGANMILFAPVFHKFIDGRPIAPGHGLDTLRAVCVAAAPVPVIALGGVTEENAPDCLEAGAAGVAAIRLFHRAESL